MHFILAIVGTVIGVVIILIGLKFMVGGAEDAGRGNCLSACCMFEMGNSLLDFGSGLIGCGTVACLALLALGLLVHGVVH